MSPRLAYLCLQVTREGQASHAHVHEIIKGLRKRGWKVELFEPRPPSSAGIGAVIFKVAEFIRTQRRLRRAGPFDVLYVRSHPLALPTSLWGRRRRLPTVQEVNGPYADLFVSYPWTRFLAVAFRTAARLSLKLADGVIAVTPQLRSWVLAETASDKPVQVVPNGANSELFRPSAPSELKIGDPYVVFFGSLSRWQGIATLLDAVRHPAWPRGVKLVVAGDGVERPRLESVEPSGPVVYLGPVPYRQIPGLVAGSLAGLSPQTDVQGRAATGLFPLKVFETLACGVPVVVTDFPGQADIVREIGCGVVVPPEDPGALAAAVAALAQDPVGRKEMGARGRRAIAEAYSWDRRAEATDRFLRHLLGGGVAS